MNRAVADRARALREGSRQIRASVELRRAPAALWPYVSNSDMLNFRSHYGPLAVRRQARAEGTPLILAAGRALGLPFEFVERPHEFVAPHRLDVDRPFLRGPIRYVGYGLTLDPLPTGGTRLTMELRWVDRFRLLPGGFAMEDRMERYLREFQRIDATLPDDRPEAPWGPFLADPAPQAAAIGRLFEAMRKLSRDPAIPRALAEFVLTAPDPYVSRIRPFEVAMHYGLPPVEVLVFLLRAVREGLFDLRWDILCPSCRGSPQAALHLADLKPSAHCASCNIDYGAGFDENVEVTFSPVARVRTFVDAAFCAGPPSAIPHVGAQFVLEAGESRRIALDLPEGVYALRDELSGFEASTPLRIEAGGRGEMAWRMGARPEERKPSLSPGARLSVENPAGAFEVLRVERAAHRDMAATAALVTSLQIFRDLFSAEVLRPGVQLGVSNVTILFSDLKDSTVLYEQRGDAPAFALVQDHFAIMTEVIGRNEGGVVKTIGDAVMAVFPRPSRAVVAAVEILQAFATWNAEQPPEQQIVIKLGLHRGPCLALNLNDRLDYFGSTVNKAARVQGQSEGDSVVVSRELFEEPDVAEALAALPPLEVQPFQAELKGIAGAVELLRLRLRREEAVA
jgi:class 3 adenylate cyclase